MMKRAKGTYEGSPIEVCFNHYSTNSSGVGCHSAVSQFLGRIGIAGISLGGKTIFGAIPLGTAITDQDEPHGIPHGVRPQAVIDLAYDHIIKGLMAGVTIFSDRVNRKTPASAGGLYEWCGLPTTCAALAKYMSTRTDLGTLTCSPLFNNPNYRHTGNYGICQVFMWIPKHVNMFTDETLGPIQPDLNLSKKDFIKKVLVTVPNATEETYAAITYW